MLIINVFTKLSINDKIMESYCSGEQEKRHKCETDFESNEMKLIIIYK